MAHDNPPQGIFGLMSKLLVLQIDWKSPWGHGVICRPDQFLAGTVKFNFYAYSHDNRRI